MRRRGPRGVSEVTEPSPFSLSCDLRRANRCQTLQEHFRPPFEALPRPRGFLATVSVLGEFA